MVFGVGNSEVSIVISAVDNFSSTFKKAGIGMREMSTAMIAIGAAGAAVGAGLLIAAKKAGQVETGFAKVNTLLDEGQKAQELYGDSVKRLNVLMGNQGDQLSALDGLYQTISAGISDAADAQFFMEKATIAAVGGSAELSSVIEAGTKTIAAFGLEISDTERVFDIFAGTVKAGQTTMGQLATAFPTVAGTAGEMGVTLEETTAIFAGLTKIMAGPEEAATSLNAVLTGLIKPSDAMKESIAGLGFESGQSAIQSLGLMGTLQALKGTTDGSAEAMGELFGNVRALRAIFPILGGASEEVASSIDIINNSVGLSNKQFEDMTQTMEYQWGVAMSEAQNTMIEVGNIMKEILLPIILKLTEWLKKLSEWWNGLSETQKKVIVTVVAVTAAVLVVVGVIGILMKLFLLILPVIKLIGIAFGLLFSPIGLIIAAIVALIAIGYLLWKHWDAVKEFFRNLWEAIKSIFFVAVDFIKFLFLNFTPLGLIIKHWEGIGNFFRNLWEGIKDVFKSGVNFVISLAEGMANMWIRAVNMIINALNKISVKIPDWVPLLGGKSFGINIPTIPEVRLPRLAQGGIIRSPTMAMIGEEGPEAIIPLNKYGGRTINIYIDNLNGFNARDIANSLQEELNKKI